jgi:hypothetical protein
MRVAAPKANIASAFQHRKQSLQMRGIKSRLDHDAPPVGKLYTQTAASRRSADQLHSN